MLEEITAEMERSRQASRSSAEAFSRIDATVDELLGFSRDVANRGEELAARGEEIVETTGTVNSLTSHIRSEYEAIEELAGRILAQIEESASSSSRGLERITSIRDSVSDFLSSITAVDARGKETGAWIASLRELIETFRYDESGDSGEAS
jgi:chromosome segregation ATPase